MSNWQNIYLSSQGRMPRLPYFGYAVLLWVIYFLVAFALTIVLQAAGLIIALVLYLALVFPFYNLMAKRLQDFNKPGKWAWAVIAIGVLGSLMQLNDSTVSLGGLLGSLQFLLALLILFLPGTAGSNDYGPAVA